MTRKKFCQDIKLATDNTMKNKELILALQREQGLGFFACDA
jgi:hypothetical protein